MTVLLTLLYLLFIYIGVSAARKYSTMTGYWIGFVTASLSVFVLEIIKRL